MDWLDEDGLARLYGTPVAAATAKVAGHITPDYRRWIEAARFCVIASVGAEGTDASPRGDDGAVARVLDDRHVAIPDWRGNDRLDTLRNIVRDPRITVMFMIRGAGNVIRLNGQARVTADDTLRASFARGDAQPRTVIVIRVAEVYFQCARAILRSGLWAGADDGAGLPSPGRILAGMTDGMVGGADYDAAWPDRAARTMW